HKPDAWKSLRQRYEAVRPRRMLALDGGGIRGMITLQALQELESKLRSRSKMGSDFRLCHFFDYISGTSTGAIIAAGLARGMAVGEILPFYRTFGREVFKKRRWGIWKSLYGNGALAKKLQEVYKKDTTLLPDDLKTLLLVVTRNATTDSVWPISSNPAAKYNDTSRPDCNLNIPLWQLVRASTAA
ncbi:MAG: patatin, partial [bacterium]|nr:patatin [bacterium]